MFMFHELNAGQNCNRKTDDKSFKSVAQFKYLGTTQTQQTCMHVQIKSRLNTREDMWENNIKMDVEIKLENMDWINLAQNTDEWQADIR